MAEPTKSIWFKEYRVEDLKASSRFPGQASMARMHNMDNMDSILGIEVVEVGPDFLKARMPVSERVRQPLGIVHGGANCVLAESIGSIASWMSIDHEKFVALGLEINANHLRPVRDGAVVAVCRPVHKGRTTHVWDIRLYDEATGKLSCISRLTVQIVAKSALSI